MRAHSCAVSPVSEPAAFEEDVAAANRLYLTRLCAPVKGREGEDDIKKGSLLLFIENHLLVVRSANVWQRRRAF